MQATKKQLRQRELAWGLYICCGFRQLAARFLPEGHGKARLAAALEAMIHSLYNDIGRI